MIKIDLVGLPDLTRRFSNLKDAIDTQQILDEGGAVMFNRIRTRFLQQIDPDGVPWIPSKAAIRRNAGLPKNNPFSGKGTPGGKGKKVTRGGGTLFDTGKLFRSLQLYATAPNERAIGTNATSDKGFPYPVVHNFGLAGFPARTFLGFGDEDVQAMTRVVFQRILRALR